MAGDAATYPPGRKRRSDARARPAAASSRQAAKAVAAPGLDALLRTRDWGGAMALARERAIERLAGRWDLLVWGLVVSAALALRLWDLGGQAIHHDESLHAYYSWQLAEGNGFQHQPLMHGTGHILLGAIGFKLFDASDFTARVPPALFGTAIVFLPFLLRDQLGRLGALLAAVFIAFSPSLLYFSRFDREDIYVAFFTLGMVVGIWRYLAERRNLWLYLTGVFMALSFATKETTYMTVAIFLTFLETLVAVDLLGQMRKRQEMNQVAVVSNFVWLLLLGWLMVLLWPFTETIRKRLGIGELPTAAVPMLVVGTLAAPQYAGLFQLIGDKVPLIPGNAGGGSYPAQTCHPDECGLRNVSVSLLLILSIYFGLLWNPVIWLIAAAFYYGVYLFVITTFFMNPEGFWTGIWGSTDYWIEQQSVRRGEQPAFYYFMLLPVYEFLPVVFALAGAVWLSIKGSAFTRFLIFWAAASLLAFTVAAEKMPWLTIHMALPLALIAAKALDALFTRLHKPVSLNIRLPYSMRIADTHTLLVGAPLLAILAVIVIIVSSASVVGIAFGFLFGLAALAAVAWAGALAGGRAFLQTGAAVVGAGLLVFSIRTAAVASFEHGDIPVELLVYTQTSPAIPKLAAEIDRLGSETGLGRDIPIYYDNADGFAWPWAWYLRDYRDVRFGTPDNARQGDILLVAQQNVDKLEVDLSQYEAARPYPHRWWFPEDYRPRPNALTEWVNSLFQPSTWDHWRDFLVQRESYICPSSPSVGLNEPCPATSIKSLGSSNAVAYFPKSFAEAAGGLAVEPPPPAPPAPAAPPGEFAAPAGLAVDSEGNLYVADSQNHRIQKLDASGDVLAVAGEDGPAGGEGQFNEPWGLALDSEGNVYVADTWNHRIQKFDSDLAFVKAWGRPFTAVGERPPESDELFGPRDIAIDSEGNLLITDTGNKRVLKFDTDGSFIEAYGGDGSGPGQFNEPVGITVAPGGDIYVADAWNQRIQHFGADFNFLGEIQVSSWGSRAVTDKPYLAVTADGRVLATDPGNAAVLVFDAAGRQVAKWDAEPAGDGQAGRPVGVYVTPAGDVYISDGAASEVRRLTLGELVGS